jgi:hypothetical protein
MRQSVNSELPQPGMWVNGQSLAHFICRLQHAGCHQEHGCLQATSATLNCRSAASPLHSPVCASTEQCLVILQQHQCCHAPAALHAIRPVLQGALGMCCMHSNAAAAAPAADSTVWTACG